mgnify:CR=1 FL=1
MCVKSMPSKTAWWLMCCLGMLAETNNWSLEHNMLNPCKQPSPISMSVEYNWYSSLGFAQFNIFRSKVARALIKVVNKLWGKIPSGTNISLNLVKTSWNAIVCNVPPLCESCGGNSIDGIKLFACSAGSDSLNEMIDFPFLLIVNTFFVFNVKRLG